MKIDDFDKYINQRKIFELNLLPPHKNEEEEEEEDDDDDDGDDSNVAPDWYDQERFTNNRREDSPRGPRKRIPGKKIFTDGIDDDIFADDEDQNNPNSFGDDMNVGPPNPNKLGNMKFGFDAMFANAHYDVKNLAVLVNQLIETNRSLEIEDNESGKIFKFEKDIEVVGLLKREGYRNKKFDYDCILVRELSDNSMYVFSTENDDDEKSKFSFIFIKN